MVETGDGYVLHIFIKNEVMGTIMLFANKGFGN